MPIRRISRRSFWSWAIRDAFQVILKLVAPGISASSQPGGFKKPPIPNLGLRFF
jgi:hypothetical protein